MTQEVRRLGVVSCGFTLMEIRSAGEKPNAESQGRGEKPAGSHAFRRQSWGVSLVDESGLLSSRSRQVGSCYLV